MYSHSYCGSPRTKNNQYYCSARYNLAQGSRKTALTAAFLQGAVLDTPCVSAPFVAHSFAFALHLFRSPSCCRFITTGTRPSDGPRAVPSRTRAANSLAHILINAPFPFDHMSWATAYLYQPYRRYGLADTTLYLLGSAPKVTNSYRTLLNMGHLSLDSR